MSETNYAIINEDERIKNKHTFLKTLKEEFISKFDNFTIEDLLKELIHRDEMRKLEIEKIRSNSAILVNWLIAIPIIISILYFLLKP